ncbi:recombinase family protein [Clostridium tarantellae]|uniref:Recombinase family protein n=1 Tax=Clostridium tarantellae TaxID=39493 RepID=A0A6I1MSG7_9CLOT|nr:recombinase family protein [Clostridium tarantellae]MPQ43831.1 recombinase family protein [Clostridium tarantellae]
MRKVTEIKSRKNILNEFKRLRVCAYVRVSTDSRTQLNSFENQKEYYERLIRGNPYYEYCGIFSDAGISGAREDRPGFKSMLEKAKAGDIDLIMTKSISRFSRNTLVLLENIRSLKEVGVGVIFEEQNINTLKGEGELMLTVLGAIAEEERKSVCSNVRWAIEKKFKSGEVKIDTNNLLGYERNKKGKIVINKEQGKIIRRIYELFLQGVPAYSIAKKLNEEKVPTYATKPWSSGRILDIISNEKYKGACLMQKTFITEDGKWRRNKGEKAKYYMEKSHIPIISKSNWEKAQVIRANRKPKKYPFTALLKCSYCGANLIRVIQYNKQVSWVCATYMQKGKATCNGTKILEKRVKEIIEDTLKEPMVVEEILNEKSTKNKEQKNFNIIPLNQYFK